jgi:hypothetical protein
MAREDRDNPADLPAPATSVPAGADGPATPDGKPPEGDGPSGVDGGLHETGLGRLLIRGQELFNAYGNWIIIGLFAIAALIWVLRWRGQVADQEQIQAVQGVYSLSGVVDQVRGLHAQAGFLPEDELAERVATAGDTYADALTLARVVEDEAMQARARRLQGDYHWYIATLPKALPATRPAGDVPALPEAAGQLEQAQSMYEAVLNEHPEQALDVRMALFALAAIAEERGDFSTAAGRYEALIARDDLPEVERQLAEQRLRLLDALSSESRLRLPTADSGFDPDLDAIIRGFAETPPPTTAPTPSTRPTTLPAGSAATTQPASP